MSLLLTLLLLAALAAPPVRSQDYDTFKMQHTYEGNAIVDCNRDLNPILQSLGQGCKSCNTVILGGQSYSTNINDVKAVCTTGGINVGGNNFQSKKTFRVVKCSLRTTGGQPPYCDYWKAGERDIRSTKITLSCVNNLPVHLNLC